MSIAEHLTRNAGDHFASVFGTSTEDAELMRLRYHLLRLELVGITDDDRRDLLTLARLAFAGEALGEPAGALRARADASPLATAIADIMDRAEGLGNTKAVMVGAILGAYTSLQPVEGVDATTVATLGAIAGATAVWTRDFIEARHQTESWDDYLSAGS